MISDHFNKIDNSSHKTLWAIAAMLVFICQIVAFFMVADGQVKKAEARDQRIASERIAVASCLETSVGAARHSCLQQARVNDNYQTAAAATVPDNSARPLARNTVGEASLVRGMLPVAFAAN